MFRLTCPRCGAQPDKAMLEVVSGMFRASKMWLRENGFATVDAKTFDTEGEIVWCAACGQAFPLGDCLEENGPPPSFEPFRGWDWTELAARFGVAIPDEDDSAPLAAWLEIRCRDEGEQDRIAGICREFVGALAATDPSHNKPVWEGLAKVEDNGTFMGFAIRLLGWMWT